MEDKIRIDLLLYHEEFAADTVLFEKLEKVAKIALKICGVEIGTANIVLTDDHTIQNLNQNHRGLDEVTDVLSFSNVYIGQYYGEDSKIFGDIYDDHFVLPPDFEYQIGEIVISLPQADKQARERSVSLEDELVTLVAHGFLHLLGYDHMEDRERFEMEAVNNKVMMELDR